MLGTSAIGLSAAGVSAASDGAVPRPTAPPEAPDPHLGKDGGGAILGPTNPELQLQNPIVEIQPGGLRELLQLSGRRRRLIPATMPHYIQNLGDEPLRYLEVFKSPKYTDVSLRQWLALTPPTLVQGHLNVTRKLLASLPTKKSPVLLD